MLCTINKQILIEFIMKILLLTQQPGILDKNEQPISDAALSNRSCALYVREQKHLGNEVVQLKVSDCEIKEGCLYYKNEPFDFSGFDGVVRRTWDGGGISFKGLEILKFLEKKGLFSDNPASAAEIMLDKIAMQKQIQAHTLSVATTYVFDNKNSEETLTDDKFIALKTQADDSLPVAVLKPQAGTRGNEIKFFHSSEIEKAKSEISAILKEGKSCILQSYIRPKLKKSMTIASAHYRIIMMRDQYSNYHFNGAIHFERAGTFISNAHHKKGNLFKEPVLEADIPSEVIESIARVAKCIGANQFGADVIESEDGKYYLLELNDCMGISGDILEEQQVAYKYAKSFSSRLSTQIRQNAQPNENTSSCFSFFRNQVCRLADSFSPIRNQP